MILATLKKASEHLITVLFPNKICASGNNQNYTFMKISSSAYFWLTIFAICFISYQQISDNIRPAYNGDNYIIKYLLGIAPNFFPAIGIPALFVDLIPQLKINHDWINNKKHLIANMISITGLITWEFIQTYSTKLHFDWNDILWTLIGASVFQLLWKTCPKTI